MKSHNMGEYENTWGCFLEGILNLFLLTYS